MRSDLNQDGCGAACVIGAIHHGDSELGTLVARSGTWRISVLARLAYEGWLVVAPRRHIESIGELDTEEGHGLGDIVGRLDRAIRAELNPAKVYLLALGDAMPHWHLLMASVSSSAYNAGSRGATVLTNYPASPDLAAAMRVARRLTNSADHADDQRRPSVDVRRRPS